LPVLFCRTATAFGPDGELDEAGLRGHLRRLVDAGIALYAGAGGNGEGYTLTRDELARVFAIAVEEGQGRVPVGANPPEQYLARDTLALAQLAADAGVDLINVFGPAPLHNFKPTEREYVHFIDSVLGQLDHPVALAPQPRIGLGASPEVIARLCDRHPQVRAVNLGGMSGDGYFMALREALTREVEIYVPVTGSMNTLTLGAAGLLNGKGEANLIPRTFAAYLDRFDRGDLAGAAEVYAELSRLDRYLDQWPGNPRWIKMALSGLRLPGGAGTVREPYLMGTAEEQDRFLQGLLSLGIAELDEFAAAAGLTPTPKERS
jgi:4-hydroxy-tetrahydrodipicolinate synthase